VFGTSAKGWIHELDLLSSTDPVSLQNGRLFLFSFGVLDCVFGTYQHGYDDVNRSCDENYDYIRKLEDDIDAIFHRLMVPHFFRLLICVAKIDTWLLRVLTRRL
jgi:hypothetical protein